MNVIVVGASRGLGKSLTIALSKAGHHVIAGVRKESDLQLPAFDSDFVNAYLMDVEKEATLLRAAQELKEKNMEIDAVVHVAGVLLQNDREKSLLEIGADDFIKTMNINVLGIALSFRAFYPLMKKNALFIAETSEGGNFIEGIPVFPAYCISKTAANKVVQTLRATVRDVNIIAMHPGRMRTDMNSTSAEIEPEETATGIMNILGGRTKLKPEQWFIDYNGKDMPY